MKKEQIETLEKAVEQLRIRNTKYKAYTEKDRFIYEGDEVFSVLDFWRFSCSQLLGMQEKIAEFLVCRALGIEKAENVNYWTAYDLSYCGKRIEVKATCYVHPWNKKVSQTRTFSITPSNNHYWSELPGQQTKPKKTRQSEVYVFCLNTDQSIEAPNPLLIDHWSFFVVPTYVVDNYCQRMGNPEQKTISHTVVKRLAGRMYNYSELKNAIEGAIERSDEYHLNRD